MKLNAAGFLNRLKKLYTNKNHVELFIRLLITFIILIILFAVMGKFTPAKKNLYDREKNTSTFHQGSSGSMALKELLESMELPVSRMMDPVISLNDLSKEKKDYDRFTMAVIDPPGLLTGKEVTSLINAAQKGSIILVFSNRSSLLTSFIKDGMVSPAALMKKEAEEKTKEETKKESINENNEDKKKSAVSLQKIASKNAAVTEDPYRIFEDIEGLNLGENKGERTCFGSLPEGWKTVCALEEGPLVIEKSVGEGKVVLMSNSSLFSNYSIRLEDNALFIYRLIDYYYNKNKNSALFFDEFHHGFHKKYTLLYFFAKKKYLVVVIQIVLFLAALFYFFAIRFGQYQSTEKEPGEERIYYFSEGMAGLLHKRKYLPDLTKLFYENFQKLEQLKFYKIRPKTSKAIHRISSEKVTLGGLKRMIKMIKKDIRFGTEVHKK